MFRPNDLRPTIFRCQATDSIPPQVIRNESLRQLKIGWEREGCERDDKRMIREWRNSVTEWEGEGVEVAKAVREVWEDERGTRETENKTNPLRSTCIITSLSFQ